PRQDPRPLRRQLPYHRARPTSPQTPTPAFLRNPRRHLRQQPIRRRGNLAPRMLHPTRLWRTSRASMESTARTSTTQRSRLTLNTRTDLSSLHLPRRKTRLTAPSRQLLTPPARSTRGGPKGCLRISSLSQRSRI